MFEIEVVSRYGMSLCYIIKFYFYRARRRRRHSDPHEYLPLPDTGPYALMVTLYKKLQKGKTIMSKADLMKEAQPLAEKSFTVPDPGCR